MELMIGSVALAPVIVALIELFKKIGMPVQYAPWVNGLLSVVGYGLVVLIAQQPTYEQPIIVVLTMLVVFLSSAGLYDRAQGTTRAFVK